MSDFEALQTATKTVLKDIVLHARGLAAGLQNAAPPQESGPGKSILYLNEIAVVLEETTQKISSEIPAKL